MALKYFVLLKKRPGATKNDFSVVDSDLLKSIPADLIEAKKKIGHIEIVTKEQLKGWTEELGGVFE